MKTAIQLVIEERQRQINVEGYDYAHDDKHDGGELAMAAACYATFPVNIYTHNHNLKYQQVFDRLIPFSEYEIKEGLPELEYAIKATALMLAEVERLQRLEISKQ